MLETNSSLLNINHQSSKLYITALLFAHKVARLATPSELNIPITLLKLKMNSYIYTWGTRTLLVLGTGTILVPGTGTVLVSAALLLLHSVLT